jgi:hypothetical protein
MKRGIANRESGRTGIHRQKKVNSRGNKDGFNSVNRRRLSVDYKRELCIPQKVRKSGSHKLVAFKKPT